MSLVSQLNELNAAMEQQGQSVMSPQAYLVSINPLVGDSPLRSRPTTSPSPPRTLEARQLTAGSVVKVPVDLAQSPPKTGNPNAVQAGAVVEVDAHPATGYPTAVDAYMNNLPDELYAPKVFIGKHVTETLELCLRVLQRNAVSRDGRLTPADVQLLQAIAEYVPTAEVRGASNGETTVAQDPVDVGLKTVA